MALIAAGEKVTAAKLNNRVGTTVNTTASSSFTAETVTDSITVSLLSGRTYGVTWQGAMQSTVAADTARARLREDSLTGTQMQNIRVAMPVVSAGFGFTAYGEYTAAATGSKTFVGTGERASGTGNITRPGAGTSPSYLYVELIG